jgi:oxygen-independent coproporphyrinogen-3 oxidase
MRELCFAEMGDKRFTALAQPAHLISRYATRMPRYICYPPPARFVTQTDDQAHRAWLQDVPPGRPVSLYIHVPFSDRLCLYSGSNTAVVTTRAPLDSYMASLIREIDLVADELPDGIEVSAVNIGGGSPNILSPADLAGLMGALRRRFTLPRGSEISAELDPVSLTPSWVEAAQALGLNRARLRVQDFDPMVQQAINRNQSFECVAACVGWLRDAGVAAINIDLIFGLPHQTVSRLLTTVMQAASLAPDRVALFAYTQMPWDKPGQKSRPEAALPSPAERFDQAQAAAGQLVSMGYVRIGPDHFAYQGDALLRAAASGRVRRNFQGYTTDESISLLGFGPSAISRLPDGHVQNHAHAPAWAACIEAGTLPTARAIELSDDDRVRAAVIEALMCQLRVDLRDIASQFLLTQSDVMELLDDSSLTELSAMEEDGLVLVERVSGGTPAAVVVTEAGRPFVRNVCALFDAYLRDSETAMSV